MRLSQDLFETAYVVFDLEMCAADKVILVQTVNGANLYASRAARTQRIINGCEIVLDLDSSVRAGLLTLHTADTAVGAIFASQRALIVV